MNHWYTTDITKRKKHVSQLKTNIQHIASQNKRLYNFTHIASQHLKTHIENLKIL
jgi:hypothetical protein